uniref:C1q domain-containing protein n=1 Tax=Periophthalmus magnuspinnatus TaxID=409849 RepID=A0A3B3ZJE0_9GOBI
MLLYYVYSLFSLSDTNKSNSFDSFLFDLFFFSSFVARRSAFTAALFDNSNNLNCLGPFSNTIPIQYKKVFTNLGNNYNSNTGIYKAPFKGVYSLSVSVFHDAGQGTNEQSCVLLYVNGDMVAVIFLFFSFFQSVTLNTPLTCAKMNCDCAFTSERSCCCGASDMYQTENYVYERMKDLYMRINKKVAFQAHMKNNIATASFTGGMACFGPFNIDVPIPFGEVLLNDYNGYNKALVVAVWENNREDFQDSATQHVILLLEKGNQVYLRLVSGRRICTTLESNTFSGFMLYPRFTE